MLQCIWPALNPLSIHVIYGDCSRGIPRGGQNVLKWQTFELTGWITWKRLKIDGYMLWCVWQALNPLFIHVIFTVTVPGAYPGRPKCALGWLQKLTHVPLAIAILLVQLLMHLLIQYLHILLALVLVSVHCTHQNINFLLNYFTFKLEIHFCN